MRWKGDDDAVILILVLAPEGSWIILCDHEKVLRHLFWADLGFVSCRALSPSCGRPTPGSPPTLGRPEALKLSSRRRLDAGFV